MDSFTQILLGAAVGEAVAGRSAGNRAMLYGAIAGTLPDLDIFAGWFTDTVSAIGIHRGISHSLLFAVLASPLLGYMVSRIERRQAATIKTWSLLFFWGLFTHSLLDIFTTWGTQLFWPLPNRLAIKSIFVIDPLYTLPLLACLIAVMRCKKGSAKRARYNTLGLCISSGYLMLTLVLKGIAYKQFEAALDEGNIACTRMETRPSPLNTILWSANIETADAYLTADYSFFDTKEIIFEKHPKDHGLLGNLAHDPAVRKLASISEGWYTITRENGTLYFNDLRFGMLDPDASPPKYAFSYRLEVSNGKVIVHEVPKGRREGAALVKKLWQRVQGN